MPMLEPPGRCAVTSPSASSLRRRRWSAAGGAAALLASLLVGCAPRAAHLRVDCQDADARLSAIWEPLRAAIVDPDGCRSLWTRGAPDPCAAWQRDLQRLAFVCPAHAPTLMVNAVLAYEDRRLTTAQQYLDDLFQVQPAHPEAAILRARVALEEGNLPFARRFLADQIRLRPDHAALREVYAGVLYLAADLQAARVNLRVAENLGAPAWRLAYHRGLIEEAASNVADAERSYEAALAARPGWEPPARRLKGLRARAGQSNGTR